MSILRNNDGTFKKGFISPQRNGETRICVCGNKFYVSGCRVDGRSRGKFCGMPCYRKSRIGKRVSPQSEFKKGSVPYIKIHPEIASRDEKHHNWKGDAVGYTALHRWVKRRLKKPLICFFCKEMKSLQLANKSQKYKRDLGDWLWLCAKCHANYDGRLYKAWTTRRLSP